MMDIKNLYDNEDGSFLVILNMEIDEAITEDVKYVYRANDPYAPAELREAIEDMIDNDEVEPLPDELKPQPEPEPVHRLYKLDLWERSTDEEAEMIEAAMAQQSAKVRNTFNSAESFREDHELWPLLEDAAVQMFGERAAELLAPSEESYNA